MPCPRYEHEPFGIAVGSRINCIGKGGTIIITKRQHKDELIYIFVKGRCMFCGINIIIYFNLH